MTSRTSMSAACTLVLTCLLCATHAAVAARYCRTVKLPPGEFKIVYGRENVQVLRDSRGPYLKLRLKSNGAGARLISTRKFSYGTLTFHAKFDTTPGAIGTVYMSSEASNLVRTQQEIDWEVINAPPGSRGTLWANIFYNGRQPGPANLPQSTLRQRTGTNQVSLSNWNKCSIKWSRSQVQWYINDKLVQTTPNSRVQTPDKQMRIMMSVWAGYGGWGGRLSVPSGKVMYTRYRDFSYTVCSASPIPPDPAPPVDDDALPGDYTGWEELELWQQCGGGGPGNCPRHQICGDYSWERFRARCPAGSICKKWSSVYRQCIKP